MSVDKDVDGNEDQRGWRTADKSGARENYIIIYNLEKFVGPLAKLVIGLTRFGESRGVCMHGTASISIRFHSSKFKIFGNRMV